MALSRFPAKIIKGLRLRLPKLLRERYNIQHGDFVVLMIEKNGSRMTGTFRVSSDGLVYLPRSTWIVDGDLVDVSLLGYIHVKGGTYDIRENDIGKSIDAGV